MIRDTTGSPNEIAQLMIPLYGRGMTWIKQPMRVVIQPQFWAWADNTGAQLVPPTILNGCNRRPARKLRNVGMSHLSIVIRQ